MPREPQDMLRRFCSTTGCGIWAAIRESEGLTESVLRQHCSVHCNAYKFNRWLHNSNLRIKEPSPGERYK